MSGVLSAGRERVPVAFPESSSQSLKPNPFEIKFLELDKNCDKTIVGNFKDWFPSWIIKYLNSKRFKPVQEIRKQLNTDVQEHIDSLQEYINALKKQQERDLNRFGNVYFEIEMNDLISKINKLLTYPVENPMDQPKTVNELRASHVESIDDLIQNISEMTLNKDAIDEIGRMFRAEFDDHDDENKEFSTAMESIVDKLELTILKIFDVFLRKDDNNAFDKLKPADIVLIQQFYDKFSFILPDEDIKEIIFEKLIGKDKVRDYQKDFFRPEFMDTLFETESPLTPGHKRDKFITNYDSRFKLLDLNEAASSIHFSWDWVGLFDKISHKSMGIKRTKIEKDADSLEDKLERKLAKLYGILYKVYTFVRSENTILNEDNVQEILQKLYDWVIDTKEFDTPTFDSEGTRVKLDKGYNVVLPSSKFKKNFLPLISLICSLLGNKCQNSISNNPRGQDILQKFKEFGNFEEIKKNKPLATFVDPKLLEEVTKGLLHHKVKELDDALETMMKENPAMDSPEEDQKITDVSVPKTSPVQRKKRVLDNPKIQEDFNEKIGNAFLGESDTPEQKIKNINNFIDNIEGTDNIHKKSVMKTLLFRFIIQLSQKKTPDSQAIIEHSIKFVLDKIRHSYSLKHIKGLQNFLFKTMVWHEPDFRYISKNPRETLFHDLDVVMFIEMAIADSAATLQSNPDFFKPQTKIEVARALKVQKDSLSTNFYNVGTTIIQRRIELKDIITKKNPLILEKMLGVEFMTRFIDFFNPYKVDSDSKAVYYNYHLIFRNFYSFLNLLRSEMLYEEENKYQFLLNQIEQCMTYTQDKQGWDDETHFHPVCQLSHRKYAEMYFFYKVYLIANEKPFTTSVNDFSSLGFNTHTRVFLAFVSQNADYDTAMTKACASEDNKIQSICVSYNLYSKMMSYLHDSEDFLGTLTTRVQDIAGLEYPNTKINVLNALEGCYLTIKKGNMINWAKIDNFISSVYYSRDENLYRKLKFEKAHLKELTNYLKRTYSKLMVSPEEQVLAHAVQAILNGPENEVPHLDSLKKFLFIQNDFIPNYLKLFLQFANTDKQFERIARLLIDNGVSYDLVKLNDISEDDFYLGTAKRLKNMSVEGALKDIMDTLSQKYKEMTRFSQKVMENSLKHEVNSGAEYDEIDNLLEMMNEDTEKVLQNNEADFETQVLPQIIKQASEEPVQIVVPNKFEAVYNVKVDEKPLNRISSPTNIGEYDHFVIEDDMSWLQIEPIAKPPKKEKDIEKQKNIEVPRTLENDLQEIRSGDVVVSTVRIPEEVIATVHSLSSHSLDQFNEKVSIFSQPLPEESIRSTMVDRVVDHTRSHAPSKYSDQSVSGETSSNIINGIASNLIKALQNQKPDKAKLRRKQQRIAHQQMLAERGVRVQNPQFVREPYLFRNTEQRQNRFDRSTDQRNRYHKVI